MSFGGRESRCVLSTIVTVVVVHIAHCSTQLNPLPVYCCVPKLASVQ